MSVYMGNFSYTPSAELGWIDGHEHSSNSDGSGRSSNSVNWTLVAKVIATCVGAVLGGLSVVAAGMALVPTICLGVAVTLSSGFGSFVFAFAVEQLLTAPEPGVAKLILCSSVAFAIVGAVAGFFVGGGVFPAVAAALALPGAVDGLVLAGLLVGDCICGR